VLVLVKDDSRSWEQRQVLKPSIAYSDASFGASVDISSESLVESNILINCTDNLFNSYFLFGSCFVGHSTQDCGCYIAVGLVYMHVSIVLCWMQ